MNIYKSNENGLTGLYNLGNTCFMNSIIQIISHIYELHVEVRNLKKINRTNNNLFIKWIRLNNSLWEGTKMVNPKEFHNEVQMVARGKNENFIGYNQNDAAEFLIFIFDVFHESCKLNVEMKINGNIKNDMDKIAYNCYKEYIRYHEKDYSLFTKLFYCMSVTTNKSKKTGQVMSQRFQSNFIIDLPIPDIKNCNLYDCFDFNFKDVELVGENGLIDENTKIRHDIIQSTKIWNLPTILIISLKRFSYNGSKNNKLIDFPLDNMDLSNYVSGYKKNLKYELFGISNHSGVLRGGHYTSYIKVKNERWYLFNDQMVTEIKDNINEIVTPKAYCLFYRLKN